ncbi:response regulator [Croceibacterium sp. TMG7-5b_MA50]|uniref:response regulator n=1 Tax=Croceibacterium sp. TMG7-5b_MA50 TaxID=3121290 RepID=UPI003221828C
MSGADNGEHCTILLVEDEPLVLMDLEIAAEDVGCGYLSARRLTEALAFAEDAEIDTAVLDVNLGGGDTCLPVVAILRRRGVPFILHSGDLDRQDELVRNLGAPLVAKPANARDVIARAMASQKQATVSS